MFPNRATFHLAGIDATEQRTSTLDYWTEEVHGYDMSRVAQLERREAVVLLVTPEQVLKRAQISLSQRISNYFGYVI